MLSPRQKPPPKRAKSKPHPETVVDEQRLAGLSLPTELQISKFATVPVAAPSPATDTGATAEIAPIKQTNITVPASVKMLGGTIAWLSGSVAGIAAIFYAFGHLITLANLNMLGLDPLAFRYDFTFYIQRGASFLLLVLIEIAQSSVWFYWPLAAMLIIGFYSCRLLARRCGGLWTKKPFRTFTERSQLCRVAAYLGLLSLLAVYLPSHFWFPEQMAISGVLYSTFDGVRVIIGGIEGRSVSQVREWIVTGNEDRLHDLFSLLVSQQITIGSLLLLSWVVIRRQRWAALMMTPFAVVFVVSTAWLPFEYGKLVLPNRFPEVVIRLQSSESLGMPQPALMYMLNKTDVELVLWDPQRHRVIWFPNRLIASLEITGSRQLSEIIRKSSGAAK